MDKAQLKNIFAALNKHNKIQITFASTLPSGTKVSPDLAHLQGTSDTYIVADFKTGRGKGGSKLLVLRKEDSNAISDRITLGTPDSAVIMNITTPDGVMHGYETEQEMPKDYPTNAQNAASLKEQLKSMLMMSRGTQIQIESSEPDSGLHGIFTLVNVEKSAGRYGQMVMNLETVEDSSPRQLWSFRHSGIVKRITVLGGVKGNE